MNWSAGLMAGQEKFSSQMDADVLRELRVYAKASGRTLASLLSEAGAAYLERNRIRPAFSRAAEVVLDEHADLLERLAR